MTAGPGQQQGGWGRSSGLYVIKEILQGWLHGLVQCQALKAATSKKIPSNSLQTSVSSPMQQNSSQHPSLASPPALLGHSCMALGQGKAWHGNAMRYVDMNEKMIQRGGKAHFYPQ